MIRYLRTLDRSANRIARAGYRMARTMIRSPNQLLRALFDRRLRAQTLFNWLHDERAHQLPNATALDRYPELFAIARDELRQKECPRILSFGCSTGEEILSLTRYLPNARFVGIDVNPWNLKIARRESDPERSSFFRCIDDLPGPLREFDAILCMAVLQHESNKPDTVKVAQAFTFDRFESQLQDLDGLLESGGLLIIEYANFLFEETNVAAGYAVANTDPGRENDHPLFGRDNRRITENRQIFRAFKKL